ncbi:MAG: cbb3-type cytochrome c oxidase N-terminal domain-containing protein [Myxococcota bacterium]
MSEKKREEDIILDHNYDGIQEYDNPMPKWWINIFIGSVVFSGLYVFHYGFGSGQGIHEAYAEEVALFEAEEAERMAKAGAATEDSLIKLTSATDNLAAGERVYVTNCQACHGPTGGGLIGPNLTDDYWLHGEGTLMGIYGTVAEGVLDKGMPAWNRVLAPSDLENVVAYVGTMRGKNVEGGKAPQGEPKK